MHFLYFSCRIICGILSPKRQCFAFEAGGKRTLADKKSVSSVVLSRLPTYLSYLKTLPASTRYISATGIAKALALGEVSVRKDLSSICDIGRPKIGYSVSELTVIIESFFGLRPNGYSDYCRCRETGAGAAGLRRIWRIRTGDSGRL